MNKNETRKILKNIRKNIENREHKDKLILNNILKLTQNKDKILLYMNVGTEVSTIEICKKILQLQKNLYLPRCINENEMNFHKISDLSQLEKSKYDLLEPKENTEMLDDFENLICFVPLLGVDLNGNRIGYGKGYYDRFLNNHNIYTVGVCYFEQVMDLIPTDNHDEKLCCVVTDKFIKEV